MMAPSCERAGGKRLIFAVPGDLSTPTGGYRYDRRIIRELREMGWSVEVADLGDSFPFPNKSERKTALALLASVPEGYPTVVDGLAFGALPEAGTLQLRNPIIALVHQPLALDNGLNAAQVKHFQQSERTSLAAASRIVVTSRTTAEILVARYEVATEVISIVPPGTDPVPSSRGSRDGVVELLSVGSIVPGKGHDTLVAAAAKLTDLPWHLTIAGDRARDPQAAAQLDNDIEGYGLGDRISLLGAVPAEHVAELYLHSDVFVLASKFESYGMALAEAVAHGLPIVSTTAGAIPATVPADAGLLVPPEDATALAAALRCLIVDPRERQRLGANARAGGTKLPRWQDSARLFAAAIEMAG